MNEIQFWILLAFLRPLSAAKQKEIYAAIYEMQPIKDGDEPLIKALKAANPKPQSGMTDKQIEEAVLHMKRRGWGGRSEALKEIEEALNND